VAARKKTNKRSKRNNKASKYSASTDKHILYQLSVQDPETEVKFITRVFEKKNGRTPLSVREDFCGTALLCAEWVKSKTQRTALGIDLDPAVLAWGKKHNLAPIQEPGNRITLLEQDVRKDVAQKFDVAVGFNFSYWVFKTRKDLLAYFVSAYRSLKRDGMFFLDTYGGYEAQEVMIEPRRIKGGFKYFWDQNKFNPIDHSCLNHIHFEFRDGTKLKKAFTYDWRYWTIIEIRELLEEAGFKSSRVFWEGTGEDGEGNGIFRPTEIADNEPAWVSYIVAER
jgi:SAM-dependent methyltransferase